MLRSLVPWIMVLAVMVMTAQQLKSSMIMETVEQDVGAVMSFFASSLVTTQEGTPLRRLDDEYNGHNHDREEAEGDFNSDTQATAAVASTSAATGSATLLDSQHTPRKRGKTPRQEALSMAQRRAQRRQQQQQQQRRRQQKRWFPTTNHPYHFSPPVIVLSLPKSGTTSLANFFQCGGIRAAHTYGRRRSAQGFREPFRIGACIKENYHANRPLLTDCKPDFYSVYSDIGAFDKNKTSECFYPSIQALDRLVHDYPNGTFILSFRHEGWYDSVVNFNNLAKRWEKRCPLFPNTTNPNVWQAFYEQHRQRIRNVMARNPGLNYFEFNLTDPMAGHKLSQFTGIDAQCWQNCKPDGVCVQRTHVNDTVLASLLQETMTRQREQMNMTRALQGSNDFHSTSS